MAIKGHQFNLHAPYFAGARAVPQEPPNLIPVTVAEAKKLLDIRGISLFDFSRAFH